MTKIMMVILSVWVALAPTLTFAQDSTQDLPGKLRPAYAPRRLLVKYRSGLRDVEIEDRVASHGLSHLRGFSGSLRHWRLASVPNYRRLEDVLSGLRRDPAIEFAEFDYVYSASGIPPDDPNFSSQWPLKNTGQSGGVAGTDINVTQAWQVTIGSPDVVVGVIDTGVDYRHPDLATNMWTNPGEIPGNGLDDDGDGYIDDVYGWNAAAGNGIPLDDNRHGTHVAGTIGAIGDNQLGVAGINWDIRVMALKFLDKDGSGYVSDAVDCISYAVAMRERGVNVRALNASWGGPGHSQALKQAITDAGTAGLLFIAAAGNNGDGSGSAGTDDDVSPLYPASYELPNLIAVAAVDRKGNLAGFSNYGARTVALGAPGVAVMSTIPGGEYASFSGTSMAAPHVTGVIALMAAAAPSATMSQLGDAILDGATPLTSLQGKTRTGGFLSAVGSLAALQMPFITSPDIRAVVSPAVATLVPAQPVPIKLTLASIGHFAGAVQLAAEVKPVTNAITVSSPTMNTYLGESGEVAVDFTAQVSAEGTSGDYLLNLSGVSGGVQRTWTVPLTVQSTSGLFSVNVSPGTVAMSRGAISLFSVNIQRASNHTLPISFQLMSMNDSRAVTLLGALPNPTRSNIAFMFVMTNPSAAVGTVPVRVRATDTRGATADSNEIRVQIR
ncbi:MAG: S8 family serine peptidase [Acidobacteria bacterium]|nr:S8 family serine peptidase [Acidobacteriota bacterium]